MSKNKSQKLPAFLEIRFYQAVKKFLPITMMIISTTGFYKLPGLPQRSQIEIKI
jgi:hypothetical protein